MRRRLAILVLTMLGALAAVPRAGHAATRPRIEVAFHDIVSPA